MQNEILTLIHAEENMKFLNASILQLSWMLKGQGVGFSCSVFSNFGKISGGGNKNKTITNNNNNNQ